GRRCRLLVADGADELGRTDLGDHAVFGVFWPDVQRYIDGTAEVDLALAKVEGPRAELECTPRYERRFLDLEVDAPAAAPHDVRVDGRFRVHVRERQVRPFESEMDLGGDVVEYRHPRDVLHVRVRGVTVYTSRGALGHGLFGHRERAAAQFQSGRPHFEPASGLQMEPARREAGSRV